ncbi:MAG: BatA domain-containing protein [Salinivirgaceae bacterium]
MQFLYPKFLWALFTLLVPIAIHLFNFKRYKTIYFSNVAFLQNLHHETKSQSVVKKIVLLLLRLLMLVALVLLFARPYIPSANRVNSGQNPLVALYIDNSFSMEAEGSQGMLLEEAKVKSLEIIESFPPQTRFLLVTNNFNPLHMQWLNNRQVVDFIAQIKATHLFRTINQVNERVQMLIPGNDSLSRVNLFVLSDFQQSLFASPLDTRKDIQVFALPFKSNTSNNLSIDSVWFATPGHYKGKQEELVVLIKNYSKEMYSDIPLQLFINDTLRNTRAFTVEANNEVQVQIAFTQWYAGAKKLRLEISDYPIIFDNSLFFNYHIADKCKILIIDGKQAPNYFRTLFADDDNFIAQTVTEDQIPYSNFSAYQLIILNQLVQIQSGLSTELKRFVADGGQVVFVPDKKGMLETYNNFLRHFSGISLNAWLTQQGNLKVVDLRNPLFDAAFKTSLNDARLPEYSGYFPMQLSTKSIAQSICTSESGYDLFTRVLYGQGMVYVTALPLNSEFTDFGKHPLFVPLFYQLALQSTNQQINLNWLKPEVSLTLPKANYGGEQLSLELPEQNSILIPRSIVTSGFIRLFPDVEKLFATTYQVFSDGEFETYASFNFDRKESEMNFLDLNELEDFLPLNGSSENILMQSQTKSLNQKIEEQWKGTDLSTYFLLFIFLLLIGEVFLIRYLY